jgi:hypothetical protein
MQPANYNSDPSEPQKLGDPDISDSIALCDIKILHGSTGNKV